MGVEMSQIQTATSRIHDAIVAAGLGAVLDTVRLADGSFTLVWKPEATQQQMDQGAAILAGMNTQERILRGLTAFHNDLAAIVSGFSAANREELQVFAVSCLLWSNPPLLALLKARYPSTFSSLEVTEPES